MAIVTKVVAIGDELAIILPEEALAHLKVGLGDTVYLVETSEAVYLTPDEDAAAIMQAASRVTSRYRDTLKKLAE